MSADDRTLEGARLRTCAAARELVRLNRCADRVQRVPADLEARIEAAETRLERCVDAEADLEKNRPS